MEWKEYSLGDISKLKYGKNVSAKLCKGPVPIFSGYRKIGTCNTINCKKNTVIVIARGAGGCGDVKLTKEDCFLTNLSISVELDKGICNAKWFYYNHLLNNLSFLNSGSAQPQITIDSLSKYLIRIPPIIIQRKIAGILSALDSKIENNNKINANLEAQAEALFKSWFVDFTPFKDQTFVDSELGPIPQGLKICQISDISHTLETGRRQKGGAVSEGIPSVGAEHVKGIGTYDYSKTKYISPEFANKLKTGKINGYELLIYKDGGKPGYFIPNFSIFGEGYPFDLCYLNEHVFKLDFLQNKGYNIFNYFQFKTNYVMSFLNAQGGKAAIPGINKKDIECIYTFAPNNPKVVEFGNFALPLFTKILRNCVENQRLAALRDTLLPKLMSGEIKL